MANELRCPNRKLFGIIDDGVIEVKCNSNRCGARSGVVILHRFDIHTGNFLETKVFLDPSTMKDRSKGYGS
jgi:hypothetical protein